MKKKFSLIGIFAVVVLAFIITSCSNETKDAPTMPNISPTANISAEGPDVDPDLVDPWTSGNAEVECGQIGACVGGYSYKIDSWGGGGMDGTHGAITITNSDGKTFDWSIAEGYAVCAVIVKAGTGAYVYYYDDATSDDGLVAPWDKDISHATFCARYKLIISKTATTEFTRTYDWTIDKSGDQTELTLSADQVFLVNYAVKVDATYIDSDFIVAGTITIENKSPLDAVITSVTDIAGGVQATLIDFEIPDGGYLLAKNSTLTIDYTVELPEKIDGTNIVTVETSTPLVTGGTATQAYTFGAPTTEFDECINVSDDQKGSLGTVCYADQPKTFNYPLNIVYDECGEFEFVNVASFETNDNGVTGSDSWTVAVTVPCSDGCTLTQGYWKTHSSKGPAPYDDTWAQLSSGADTPFFLSGQTYYEVLWTPPSGGNVYYILAHQYIAAELNMLNGASSTPEVDEAMSWATNFFNTYTPTAKLGKTESKEAKSYAGLLDQYNNGLIGPGHCSE